MSADGVSLEEREVPVWVVHQAVANALGRDQRDICGIESRDQGRRYAIMINEGNNDR